ncbi:hypothetical protein ACFL3Q_10775, partial [Planctomycetota bacterium]
EKSVNLAGLRKTDIRTLERRLHGELDWITLKAMDKDRTRRYQTAYALAEDIQRYLSKEPVLAGPPSTIYKFRKFAARNKGVFVSVATIAVVVVLAAIISIILAITATKAKMAETQQRQKAETLSKQQEEDLYFNHIKLAHQELNANRPVHALELLEKCPEELRKWEWHYLQRRSRSKEPPAIEFSTNVVSFDISPDGSNLAALCADGKLIIRDISSGQETSIQVRSRKQLPDSDHADPPFPFYGDGTNPFFQFYGDYKDPFMQWVTFCDATNVAISGDDHTVYLISIITGEIVQRYSGLTDTVTQIDCSPDGDLIAAASYGSQVVLWDRRSGIPQAKLEFEFLQTSLAFTGDGKHLLIGGGQHTKLFNLESLMIGEEDPVDSTEIGYEIREFCASPDGQHIATAVWDGTVLICNSEYEEPASLEGHADGIRGIAYNADGTRLASISDDLTIRLWDTGTGREILVLDGGDPFLNNICFSRLTEEFIVGDFSNSLRVFSASPLSDARTETSMNLAGHTEMLYCINYSPDGNQLISSGQDGINRIWNALNGQEIRQIDIGRQDSDNSQFSPNGRWIASMGIPEGRWTVKVLEATDPSEEYLELEFEIETSGVTFSADGQYLIVGANGKDLTAYSLRSKAKEGEFGQQEGYIISIVASPDGKHLASAAYCGGVKVWDATRLNENQEGRLVYNNNVAHFRASFSHDGRRLALGGRDGEITILDVELLRNEDVVKPLLTIPNAHGDTVSCVSFGPRGKYLASCSSDKTVRIWDTHTGRQVDILLEHKGRILSVAFSPDGKHVASVGTDQTVRIWTPRLE